MDHFIQQVPGTEGVFYKDANFEDIDVAFRAEGLRFLTGEELAGRRIDAGHQGLLSTNGSWVKEGLLYVPGEEPKRYLVRDSFILPNTCTAREAHKAEKKMGIDSEEVRAYLQDEEKALALYDRTVYVPSNRFGEDPRTIWLFGSNAQRYGHFHGEKFDELRLSFEPDCEIDSQGQPYANQLYVANYGKKEISGYVDGWRRLDWGGNIAFGVPNETETSSPVLDERVA